MPIVFTYFRWSEIFDNIKVSTQFSEELLPGYYGHSAVCVSVQACVFSTPLPTMGLIFCLSQPTGQIPAPEAIFNKSGPGVSKPQNTASIHAVFIILFIPILNFTHFSPYSLDF